MTSNLWNRELLVEPLLLRTGKILHLQPQCRFLQPGLALAGELEGLLCTSELRGRVGCVGDSATLIRLVGAPCTSAAVDSGGDDRQVHAAVT